MKLAKKIQIAIADDHDLICDGLKSIIEARSNFEVSLLASNGLELVRQIKSRKVLPDICIIDISMGPLNGYETMLVIQRWWPQVKIIMLSMYDNELLITKMLQGGASSYLFKNSKPTILIEAISHVLQSGCYHTEEVSKILLQQSGNKNSHLHITDKELRFLSLCTLDIPNKTIADRMGVETRTVDNYRDSLLHKLNKSTKNGLAVFATLTGLCHLSTEYLLSSGLLDKL